MVKNKFSNCNSQWRLMRHLLRENWKIVNYKEGDIKIGSAETVVFQSPCNQKILRINNGMWKDFALYLDVARALPDNPYLQNVDDDFFLDDGTYCVELEPLIEGQAKDTPIALRGRHIILSNLLNRPFKNSRPSMIDRMLKRDSALKEAMTALFVFQQSAYLQDSSFDPFLDLHGGNIMVRKTDDGGDIVLSDPFTWFSDGNSEEYQEPRDILWRRKLGLLDYGDVCSKGWQIKPDRHGFGCFTL